MSPQPGDNQGTGFKVPGVLQLGGDRAARLELHVETQIGGAPDTWTVEGRLVRSADDPWPEIRYLVFSVEPFVERAARSVATILGEHS